MQTIYAVHIFLSSMFGTLMFVLIIFFGTITTFKIVAVLYYITQSQMDKASLASGYVSALYVQRCIMPSTFHFARM